MVLIDSPGTNDPDQLRRDKDIQTQLFNMTRSILTDEKQGITSYTQCVMPNISGRIRQSVMKSMMTLLLSLTSFYPDIDLSKHPKLFVIFNNVSK